MIRGLFYWIGGLIFTILIAPVFFMIFLVTRGNQDRCHLVIRFWTRVLLGVFCGVKIKVSGAENLAPDQHYVIVSNHRSYIDILLGTAALPLQFRWLAKSSLYRIPVIGPAMKRAGYIPVQRTKAISASHSLDAVRKVLEGGRSVWIFPEGTRTPRDRLGPFKRGAFLLAKQTGVRVLPVVMVNTDSVFVRPLVIKSRNVKLIILKPSSYNSYRNSHQDDRRTLTHMAEDIRQTIQKIYNNHVT
jgi:1-acyl-sn-glycerol-3-phosphate acyltransferase